MKNLLLCVFFVCFSFVAVAQKRDYKAEIKQFQDSINKNFPKNTIYLELLGSGGLYSINYDRIFYQKNRFKFSYRLGGSITPLRYKDIVNGVELNSRASTAYGSLLGLNIIQGSRNRFTEFGVVYIFTHSARPVVVQENPLTVVNELAFKQYISLNINYRRQSQKGLFFKIGALIFKDIYDKKNVKTLGAINGVKGLPGWLWSIGIGVGKSF